MNFNASETVVVVDCDDTLCMWSDKFTQPHEGAIPFHDPYDNSTNYLKPHTMHVELIKKYKGRGFHIIVWSAAGCQWAKSVVETLGLTDYVDQIMTKPIKYVDDITDDNRISRILGTRVYIPYEE